jgi:hypothetical protein
LLIDMITAKFWSPNVISCLFIKCVLNIKDTNTETEKYSRLYRPIDLFIFRIYNMG